MRKKKMEIREINPKSIKLFILQLFQILSDSKNVDPYLAKSQKQPNLTRQKRLKRKGDNIQMPANEDDTSFC